MSLVASFDAVSVTKEGSRILSDISWDIDSSERWVIVGPNGAGKTTLLGLLASFSHPSAGTVTVLGETLGKTDVFELRPRVGFASSDMANRIPYNETVLDTILTAAYGVTGRWKEDYESIDIRRAQRVLAEWNLENLAESTMRTLSDGERKRVQIARAVMTDPEMLLLDEPLLGLSPVMEEMLIEAIEDINKKTGITVLITEQYARPVLPIIHNGYVFENGGVVLEGSSEELMDNPDVKSAYFGM